MELDSFTCTEENGQWRQPLVFHTTNQSAITVKRQNGTGSNRIHLWSCAQVIKCSKHSSAPLAPQLYGAAELGPGEKFIFSWAEVHFSVILSASLSPPPLHFTETVLCWTASNLPAGLLLRAQFLLLHLDFSLCCSNHAGSYPALDSAPKVLNDHCFAAIWLLPVAADSALLHASFRLHSAA